MAGRGPPACGNAAPRPPCCWRSTHITRRWNISCRHAPVAIIGHCCSIPTPLPPTPPHPLSPAPRAMRSAHARWCCSRWLPDAPLEFVADGRADDPRPQRCLCDDELIGADEGAGVRVGKILAIHIHVPGILADAE